VQSAFVVLLSGDWRFDKSRGAEYVEIIQTEERYTDRSPELTRQLVARGYAKKTPGQVGGATGGSGDEVDQGFAYVVVTDSDQGRILATRLRRMDIAKVTAVIGLEEARRLCQSGGADACLVAIDAPVPDGVPVAESDAPGRCCGVPALLVCSSGHAPPAGDRTPLRVLGRRVCGNPAAHALPPP